jgi:hypothetical protein
MKNWITSNMVILLVMAVAITHLHACMNSPKKEHKKNKEVSKSTLVKSEVTGLQSAPAADCDSSKWVHVYDPDRLHVLDRCKVVTGVIAERNADPDGDEHMLLKLDKGQNDLLLKKNYSKKEGDLVVEVVCVNNITRKRAKGACDGYTNNVQLPSVGDHVRVTGSYVNDTHNGWAEIHPATKIEKIN